MTLSNRIRHLSIIILLLLFVVSIQIVYWPLIRGQALQSVVFAPQSVPKEYTAKAGDESVATTRIRFEDLAGPVKERTIKVLRNIKRGSIYDRHGHLLVYDQENDRGDSVRFYSEPFLAHVVGLVDRYGLGLSGIEYGLNDSLLGLDRIDRYFNQLVQQPREGSHVDLTIDTRLQHTAAQALLNRSVTGAIVVMDAHTGAILAMVSAPTFDANLLLSGASQAEFCIGSVGCDQALFNRATQGLYPPGSTWKTVTLIAALESGQATPDTVFDFGEPRCDATGCYYGYEVDGHFIEDRNHYEQSLSLSRSYVLSANTTFARLGDQMDSETLIEYARRFGFSHENGAPPIEIDASAAQLANNLDQLYSHNHLRAATGIGQGELLASPLSMALVVSAVLNDGNIPIPHLVQAIRHPSDRPLEGEASGYWMRNTMRAETAQQVREMMIQVVNSHEGTGIQAGLPGVLIGGKTGTAQVGGNSPPHAWFTGFAEVSEEQAAVIVVLVEHGGEGGQVAAPIFAEVAQVAIQYLGEP